MFTFYDATVIITVITLLITLFDIKGNRVLARNEKIKMLSVCLLVGAAALCEWAGVRTDGSSPDLIWLHYTVKFLEFSLTPIAGIVAADAYGDAKGLRFMVAFTVVNVVIEFISLWTGWIFVIDASNLYHRASLYFIYVAFFAISIIYCFVCIIIGNKKYNFGIDATLILILILFAVGIVIQMIFSSIRVDFLCITLGNVVLYARYGNSIMRLDQLTKLLTRRCYEINLRSVPDNSIIIFFDVNDFKQVNDNYGHAEGDECLKKISAAIHGVYSKYGSCYRIGGDEFCVIMTKNTQNFQTLNEKFSQVIERLHEQDERIPTVALGYAKFDKTVVEDVNQAVSNADEMMYAVKNKQKNGEPYDI